MDTLNLTYETKVNKLKIELATVNLSLKVNADQIKRLDVEVTYLGTRDRKHDTISAMEQKSAIQNNTYKARASIR